MCGIIATAREQDCGLSGDHQELSFVLHPESHWSPFLADPADPRGQLFPSSVFPDRCLWILGISLDIFEFTKLTVPDYIVRRAWARTLRSRETIAACPPPRSYYPIIVLSECSPEYIESSPRSRSCVRPDDGPFNRSPFVTRGNSSVRIETSIISNQSGSDKFIVDRNCENDLDRADR